LIRVQRDKKKYEYIMIRCSKKTKEKWRISLLEFKKKGFTAEDVLLAGIKSIQDHIEGRVL